MKNLIAIGAVLLTACGGGGDGSDAPAAPAQPACTPRVVTVALLGDSTMFAIDGSLDHTLPWDQIRSKNSPHVELQALMDARFGKGMVVVTTYAVPGSTADMAPKIVADVVVENFGVNDMNEGVSIGAFTANVRAISPTIVQTQYPAPYGEPRETPYVEATRGLGIPVSDAYAYIKSLPNWQSYFPRNNSVHVTDELTRMVVQNALAPVVTQQVEAKRCLK